MPIYVPQPATTDLANNTRYTAVHSIRFNLDDKVRLGSGAHFFDISLDLAFPVPTRKYSHVSVSLSESLVSIYARQLLLTSGALVRREQGPRSSDTISFPKELSDLNRSGPKYKLSKSGQKVLQVYGSTI